MVLSKPFRRNALVAAVKSLLGSDGAARDHTAKLLKIRNAVEEDAIS
jgi:hypothetical protein